MRFRPLSLLFLLGLALPVLAGCEGDGGGSDLSSGSVNDSSDVPPDADPLPEGWDGIVRIHYRNDTANYMTKAIWVWGVGIDGYEYEFDNAGAPDDYGLYYDVDLQESPWNRAAQSSISSSSRSGAPGRGKAPTSSAPSTTIAPPSRPTGTGAR